MEGKRKEMHPCKMKGQIKMHDKSSYTLSHPILLRGILSLILKKILSYLN